MRRRRTVEGMWVLGVVAAGAALMWLGLAHAVEWARWVVLSPLGPWLAGGALLYVAASVAVITAGLAAEIGLRSLGRRIGLRRSKGD